MDAKGKWAQRVWGNSDRTAKGGGRRKGCPRRTFQPRLSLCDRPGFAESRDRCSCPRRGCHLLADNNGLTLVLHADNATDCRRGSAEDENRSSVNIFMYSIPPTLIGRGRRRHRLIIAAAEAAILLTKCENVTDRAHTARIHVFHFDPFRRQRCPRRRRRA